MSLGEDRVRITFNPSVARTHTIVDLIKQKTAELIDLCEDLVVSDPDCTAEKGRCVSLAQTAYEEAAMWAVKAATAAK